MRLQVEDYGLEVLQILRNSGDMRHMDEDEIEFIVGSFERQIPPFRVAADIMRAEDRAQEERRRMQMWARIDEQLARGAE